MTNTPSQRYEVIERLDAGGMAEVFRGRAISIEGFEKKVAIKRVLPHLAKNQKFVNMFLDEAKLSLFLDHANVVSVFDLGRAADTYFIVMEFVDGANLKKVLEWGRKNKHRVPIEVAAYIAIEVCKGLEYAHTKQDPNGDELNIVHRDISPPNVLLSRQGEVKVTDFGLAKAQSQIEVTDPGVVKGKFGYLSPEAAIGDEVTAATDVFAVGIVLWEMIAGRRLFQGTTDLETLQYVRKAEIPPLRDFNPETPPALEQICRDALTRDPKKRIQSAREMGTKLSRFLFKQGVSVTSYDVAAYVTRVVDDDVPSEDSDQRRIMSTVIQDEINKLIRIENRDLSQTIPAMDSGPLEDPRTWGDLAFDDLPPSNLRDSAYASAGSQAVGQAGGVRVSASVRSVPTQSGATPQDTPLPARNTPPPLPNVADSPRSPSSSPRRASASAPRAENTASREAAEEKKAMLVFYGLFFVVSLVAAYVVYLLLSSPA